MSIIQKQVKTAIAVSTIPLSTLYSMAKGDEQFVSDICDGKMSVDMTAKKKGFSPGECKAFEDLAVAFMLGRMTVL